MSHSGPSPIWWRAVYVCRCQTDGVDIEAVVAALGGRFDAEEVEVIEFRAVGMFVIVVVNRPGSDLTATRPEVGREQRHQEIRTRHLDHTRPGLSIDDIGVYEVNEAFAPVPLAWQVELGAKPERLNPLGGAIAVGHPLGASGTILMTRMIHQMRDKSIRYGLQTMCEAGGTANATILELLT